MSLNPKALEVYMIKKQLSRFYFSKEWNPMTTLMDFSSQSPFFPRVLQLPRCQETRFSLCQSPFQDPQSRAFFFFNGEITFPV